MIWQYLVGSKKLGLQNARDMDILLIFEDEQITKENAHQILKTSFDIDYRIWKKDDFEKFLTLDFLGNNPYNFLWLYQCDTDIIKQDFKYDFHILSIKDKMLPLLKSFLQEVLYSLRHPEWPKDFNIKWVYHLAYNIFIFQNRTPHLTNEQIKKVQKLHDKNITINDIKELEYILHSL